MKIDFSQMLNHKLPINFNLILVSLLGVVISIFLDDFEGLGAHYANIFMFMVAIAAPVAVLCVFYRNEVIFSALISAVVSALFLITFSNNHPIADEVLKSVVNLNKPLMDSCATDAKNAKSPISTCLEENGFIEWKRVLIYVPQAAAFPSGELIKSHKIDQFDQAIKAFI